MPKIKVIAFDVYGTILCAEDTENTMPPREGVIDFIVNAKANGIRTVTSSDADLEMLQLDLQAVFHEHIRQGAKIFDDFFQLSMRPKRYEAILQKMGISGEQLMVIGNDMANDLSQAPAKSTKILVPTYRLCYDHFNFLQIDIK